jgi:hypothetical protein
MAGAEGAAARVGGPQRGVVAGGCAGRAARAARRASGLKPQPEGSSAASSWVVNRTARRASIASRVSGASPGSCDGSVSDGVVGKLCTTGDEGLDAPNGAGGRAESAEIDRLRARSASPKRLGGGGRWVAGA